jgi:hypothetical protein
MDAVLKQNDKLTWCGFAPGQSTLQSLVAKLGDPEEIEELTNGKIYYFSKGMIQATVLDDSPAICKIFIDRDMLTEPKTLAEFEQTCGPITEKLADKLQGLIYERPGVRLATDFLGDQARIRWIELF